MSTSRRIAGLAFLLVVPACIALAYGGHWAGLYGYGLVPIAFGVVFVVVIAAVFAIVQLARARER